MSSAPDVAKRLDVPYLERIVSHGLARAVSGDAEGATVEEERGEGFWRRLFEALTTIPSVIDATMPQPDVDLRSDEQLRDEVEATIRDTTRSEAVSSSVAAPPASSPVFLGIPRAARRPAHRRVVEAMQIEQIGRDEAERRLTEVDRTRAAYVRRLYGCDVKDPSLYHLVFDSTTVPRHVRRAHRTRGPSIVRRPLSAAPVAPGGRERSAGGWTVHAPDRRDRMSRWWCCNSPRGPHS